MNAELWPFIAYATIVILLIIGLLVASYFLGQKRKDHATHDVYESGQLGVGSAQLRMNVPFYLTAIMFIIFDLEVVFLVAWAISIREGGWLGFVEVFIFISILIAGLIYLWKSGALEWRTLRQQQDHARIIGEGGVVNVKRGQAKTQSSHDGHHDTGAAH